MKQFILFLVVSFVYLINGFHKYMQHISSSSTSFLTNTLSMKSNPDSSGPKKNTMFDRVVDDFIGKRYGAGEAFYGKRASKLTEEEYAKTQKQKRVYDPNAPMRDDAILLVGGVDEISQWVAFELNEKGFNVRIGCSQLKQATDIFGFPGFNVDVIELQGSKSSEETYARAINGVQAIVLAVNFSPTNNKQQYEEELAAAKAIIDISIKARKAKVGEVKKIVMVSRVLPEVMKGNPDMMTSILQKRVDSDMFKEFRAYHDDLEKYLRISNFEYAIIRIPPIIKVDRAPSEYPLTLLSSQDPLSNSKSKRSASGFPLSLLSTNGDEQVDCPVVGVLDLAEVVTQSLLQDVSDITYSVCETDSLPADVTKSNGPVIIAGQRDLENSRVLRKSYYGILDMDDEDLRSSYMIRPAEQYQSQLKEDEALEKYWLQRLTLLEKDN